MYMYQILKAEDTHHFRKVMLKEVKDLMEKKHWSIIKKENIPNGTIILPSVWAMRRKRRITTREVYKWKVRLNIGGHKMVKGIHYKNILTSSGIRGYRCKIFKFSKPFLYFQTFMLASYECN